MFNSPAELAQKRIHSFCFIDGISDSEVVVSEVLLTRDTRVILMEIINGSTDEKSKYQTPNNEASRFFGDPPVIKHGCV